MGLDAHVHCDCFERGRLRTPPLPEWFVTVDPVEGRVADAGELDRQIAFDAWNVDACEHAGGMLLHERLGNTALVAFFRDALASHSDRLPVLTAKVIYSGTHAGDHLDQDEVRCLGEEVDVLATVRGSTSEDEQILREFERQLRRLVAAALGVRKPITF
jgi:hypothetical protein